MHPIARIDIISDEVEMHKVLDRLDNLGVSDYSVMRNVLTKANRGTVADDLAVTGLGNVHIIAYFAPEKVKAAIAEIRPILNKFGGSCYISDAQEVRSVHCVASV